MRVLLGRVLTLWFGACVSISGCVPFEAPIPDGEKIWEGAVLEVWAAEDAQICGGSIRALEQQASLIAQFAEEGGVPTRPPPYRFSWISPSRYDQTMKCPANTFGCFEGSKTVPTAFARGYSGHEVVHAVFASGVSSFAEEGLATVLGDFSEGVVDGEALVRPDVPEIVKITAGQTLLPGLYLRACKFVSAAFELYPETALQALMRTRRSDDYDAFVRRMAEGGVDVRAAVEFNRATPLCSAEAFRHALAECAYPLTQWSGDTWRAQGRLSCEAPDVMGPSAERLHEMWLLRAIDIPEEGKYTLFVEVADGTVPFVTFAECDAPWCDTEVGVGLGFGLNRPQILPGVSTLRRLRAGRHWFRVAAPVDQPTESVRLAVVKGWRDLKGVYP